MQTMMAGQTNQYRVTKRRLINAIRPTIDAMSKSDVFSSRLDIGTCLDIETKKATALLFFLPTSSVEFSSTIYADKSKLQEAKMKS
jgi:hypothetical protein